MPVKPLTNTASKMEKHQKKTKNIKILPHIAFLQKKKKIKKNLEQISPRTKKIKYMKRIVILIPCFNEEITVAKVVSDFKIELPKAEIIVLDNCCTDQTIPLAKEAGAKILTCSRKGKGAAVRKAFQEIDADIYILVDGDDTYPAEAIHSMLDALNNGADMVVGDRLSGGRYFKQNKRPMHNIGNLLVRSSINFLFRTQLKDVLSGYRVFSKTFVKNCPILLDGFEVESEMSIHAVDKLFEIKEIPIAYRDRPLGSKSKLNTIIDGTYVLRSILWIFKDSKPLLFFGLLGILQWAIAICSLLFAYPILTASLFLSGCSTFTCGFILDTLVKYHRDTFQISMLQNRKNKVITSNQL